MRIDSYDVNLVTGGERFPVDLSLPPIPPGEGDLDLSILVHDDAVDFSFASPPGLPPLHGRDEIEVRPPVGYEPGLDQLRGPGGAGLAPLGLQADALEPAPRARRAPGVAPFSTAVVESDALVRGRNLFAPFLDPFSFNRGDALERVPRFNELRAPAAIGRDALETDQPDWDVRQPLVGRDEAVFPTAVTTRSFPQIRDGLDYPRRAALMLRI